jgi:hypothetical protein
LFPDFRQAGYDCRLVALGLLLHLVGLAQDFIA